MFFNSVTFSLWYFCWFIFETWCFWNRCLAVKVLCIYELMRMQLFCRNIIFSNMNKWDIENNNYDNIETYEMQTYPPITVLRAHNNIILYYHLITDINGFLTFIVSWLWSSSEASLRYFIIINHAFVKSTFNYSRFSYWLKVSRLFHHINLSCHYFVITEFISYAYKLDTFGSFSYMRS